MEKDTQTQAEGAIAALDQVRTEWLERSGVTGIDVGLLWREGVMSDQVGIRVKVKQLLEPEDVPDGELFPRYHAGYRVQVLEEEAPVPQPAAAELAREESAREGEIHAEETGPVTD